MQCVKHARQIMPDATISVEVEKPHRKGLQELAAEADVVFFSKSWAEAQGYTTSKAFLEYQGNLLKERRYVHRQFCAVHATEDSSKNFTTSSC
jgi:ketohexokinase